MVRTFLIKKKKCTGELLSCFDSSRALSDFSNLFINAPSVRVVILFFHKERNLSLLSSLNVPSPGESLYRYHSSQAVSDCLNL